MTKEEIEELDNKRVDVPWTKQRSFRRGDVEEWLLELKRLNPDFPVEYFDEVKKYTLDQLSQLEAMDLI